MDPRLIDGWVFCCPVGEIFATYVTSQQFFVTCNMSAVGRFRTVPEIKTHGEVQTRLARTTVRSD